MKLKMPMLVPVNAVNMAWAFSIVQTGFGTKMLYARLKKIIIICRNWFYHEAIPAKEKMIKK